MPPPTTWIIGSDPAGDLVVDRPSVSWRHCRLTLQPDGTFTVEDLNSTNGTYLNGQRLRGVTALRPGDPVTLGLTVPMPWPEAPSAAPPTAPPPPPPLPTGSRVITVGRDPGNDVVIESPGVSARHARVSIPAGGREGVVEDLGSTNGTSVGAPGRPTARATIGPADVIYFGPVAYPASALFAEAGGGRPVLFPSLVFDGEAKTIGRDPGNDIVVDFPVVSSRHARIVRADKGLVVEDLGSSNGTYVNGTRVDRSAPARAGDLIGFGSYTMVLVGGPAPAPDAGPAAVPGGEAAGTRTPGALTRPGPRWAVAAAGVAVGAQAGLLSEAVARAEGRSPEVALFGLSLAAVWFGLTSAVFERWRTAATDGGDPGRGLAAAEVGRSLARAGVLDLSLCAVLLVVTSRRLPFGGNWPGALGTLVLAALVGSAAGLVLVRLLGRPAWALAGAALLLGLMATVGGPNRPLSDLDPVRRAAVSVMPTRWAYEAVLTAWAGRPAADLAADPVEKFFPAETDRAGPLACASALLALLGGVVYLDLVIALARPPAGRPGV